MAPPLLARAANVQRTIRTGTTLYRRTPPRLRRPETAARLALGGTGAWFAVLFGALALLTARTTPMTASIGFACAAVVGIGAIGLASARRLRPAMWCIAVMLIGGQVVTIAAAL